MLSAFFGLFAAVLALVGIYSALRIHSRDHDLQKDWHDSHKDMRSADPPRNYSESWKNTFFAFTLGGAFLLLIMAAMVYESPNAPANDDLDNVISFQEEIAERLAHVEAIKTNQKDTLVVVSSVRVDTFNIETVKEIATQCPSAECPDKNCEKINPFLFLFLVVFAALGVMSAGIIGYVELFQ